MGYLSRLTRKSRSHSAVSRSITLDKSRQGTDARRLRVKFTFEQSSTILIFLNKLHIKNVENHQSHPRAHKCGEAARRHDLR